MIISPRSAAPNAVLALAPRTPPPAAWKISACVSVTAAESATAPPRRLSQRGVRGGGFSGNERPPERRGERFLDIRVGSLELWVTWRDVDCADYRPRRVCA